MHTMSGRWLIIGAQALAVAAIAAVVYVTLLKPHETEPLEGVQGPPAPKLAVKGPKHRHPHGSKAHPRRRGTARLAVSRTGPTGAPSPARTLVVPVVQRGGPAPVGPGTDEYSDAVQLLRARLRGDPARP
jgi:hypothetical protein